MLVLLIILCALARANTDIDALIEAALGDPTMVRAAIPRSAEIAIEKVYRHFQLLGKRPCPEEVEAIATKQRDTHNGLAKGQVKSQDCEPNDECCCEIELCDRLIVQTTRQPNTTNNPLAVYDPFHARAIASGFYTNATAQALQARANAYFFQQFGINTSNSVPGPLPDTRIILNSTTGLPFALNIPYGFGLDGVLKIAVDTERCERGWSGKWFFLAFGQLIQFIAPGNLTDAQGRVQHYDALDLIVYHEVWMVKGGYPRWLKPDNNELMIVQSEYIGESLFNSQGQIEQHIKVRTYTLTDGVGFGTLFIAVNLLNNPPPPQTPIREQINRGTYTWGTC